MILKAATCTDKMRIVEVDASEMDVANGENRLTAALSNAAHSGAATLRSRPSSRARLRGGVNAERENGRGHRDFGIRDGNVRHPKRGLCASDSDPRTGRCRLAGTARNGSKDRGAEDGMGSRATVSPLPKRATRLT